MTHYDSYPYPSPEDWTPDEVRLLFTDYAPRAEIWGTFWPDEAPSPKTALVVGCGMYEATAIAAQEPLLTVTAIDASANTIALAAEKAGMIGPDGRKRPDAMTNLTFIHAELLSDRYPPGPYDFVACSGVLHHIPNVDPFLDRLAALTKKATGRLSLLVYGSEQRQMLEAFTEVLKLLDIKRDAEGIALTRAIIRQLPKHHPIVSFHNSARDNDSQIVDLYLHPYFRHYRADELLGRMERHGFKLFRWLTRATDYRHFKLGAQFDTLPEASKCRIAQVLNHADAKLIALFTNGEHA